ncbi:MAG TPA: TetR/AcrR family transcriptional regulator [Desulfuromonadales bacterium]|nr:TetR/AcrR family transcriptional regulator [Desulfuromonadales bacterium]
MRPPDTKQRLLDAAEQLFALRGFHATSLRAITQAAEVNLAAVNYHFGSKEALLDAVMARSLGPLNQVRSGRLDEVERDAAAENRAPDLRALWRAFVEPTLSMRRHETGAEHFLSLVGQALAQPHGAVMEVFMRQMTPMFLRLFELTCLALPEMPRQLLFWRMHFAVGSLSHLMRCNDQSPVLPAGITAEIDVDTLTDMLLDYTLAGLEAPR